MSVSQSLKELGLCKVGKGWFEKCLLCSIEAATSFERFQMTVKELLQVASASSIARFPHMDRQLFCFQCFAQLY